MKITECAVKASTPGVPRRRLRQDRDASVGRREPARGHAIEQRRERPLMVPPDQSAAGHR